MLIFLLLIGVVLMVTAFAGTYSQLATELENDIPGYFKWGFALAAIVAFGYVPGMKTASRWLLAIVILVLVLKGFPTLKAQLTNFMNQGAAAAGGSNTAATATNAVVQSAVTTAAQGVTTSPLPVTQNLLGGQVL